jgi:protein-tyrosine phosphatase
MHHSLIEGLLIDIHTHILPGVDDGPDTMDEAVKIVEKAAGDGVRCIVATPHMLEAPSVRRIENITSQARILEREISSRNLDMTIKVSAEFFISPDLPDYMKTCGQLAIPGEKSYVLVELPMYQVPEYTDTVIFQLGLDKYTPIIAHPERNMEIQQDPQILDAFIQRGALAQLNAGSLTGQYGRRAKKAAQKLLRQNLIHMMGSDIHSCPDGPYPLVKGLKAAAKIVGRERAGQLVSFLAV